MTFVAHRRAWFPIDRDQAAIYDDLFDGAYPANTIVEAAVAVTLLAPRVRGRSLSK